MLSEAEIAAVLRRTGLVAADAEIRTTPLDGGVSSDIWLAEASTRRYCVKRALPRLKVPQLWEAPVARNAAEWKWIETARAIVPGSAPAVLARDEAAGLFVMEFLAPELYPNWKALLRDGALSTENAIHVAERLAAIHGATAGRDEIAAAFDTGATFHAIRLEPYLIATGRVHRDLAPQLEALAARTFATRHALVHGDVSPKNILIGPDGPVFIDAECAWYGEPAFDLAFCLNHLLLKCLWRPQRGRGYLDLFEALARHYLARVSWQASAEMDRTAAALLPALLLGRIDGKSPIEYVTDDETKNLVRRFARGLIAQPVDRVEIIRAAWARAIGA